MNKSLYWYWMCNIKGIGQKKTAKLLDCFGDPEGVWRASEKDLSNVAILRTNDIKKIIESRDEESINIGYKRLQERNIKFITIDDKEYPPQLKNIYDPPFGIYNKGILPNEKKLKIAIVGARKCTSYGKEMAKYFARELANLGVEVISGLARGIDAYAHQGAIEGKGKTYSVLGNGLNICYPQENISLFMEVEKQGGIISEYNLDVKPNPSHFPLRNRIISGLSDGILVIEAAKKSGSLITAEISLEQGREVFALPGRITDKLSEGTNEIIKMGGKMVTSIEDILEEFQYIMPKYERIEEKIENKLKLLDKNEKMVYACLSLEPKYIDEIANELKIEIQKVNHLLFILEIKGLIKQLPNKYFIINV
ncbi:DNA processing protein [Natranaerovirga pectinivora]|uniref:DNA processing protein n=1 Tax=Natranaerovirga pectinivora TaxID=682400 RepID=A0A4R3MN39_9FIRM|nr:DNA-processing protein DprA [Natranaerovirga pectinivora]TCT16413.1 DNA processing protein [Natranaerovirga pectinivora]